MTDAEKKKKEEEAVALQAAKDADAAKGNDPTGNKISSDADLQNLHEATRVMKEFNERSIKEAKQFGEVLGETKHELDKAGKRLDGIEEVINKKFDEFDKQMNRKRIYVSDSDSVESNKRARIATFFKCLNAAAGIRFHFEKTIFQVFT